VRKSKNDDPRLAILNRRLGRRALLRGAMGAGVGLTALYVVGCGDDDDAEGTPTPGGTTTATATPADTGPVAPTGRVVFGVGGTGPAIDPGTLRTAPAAMLYFAIWDPMVFLDPFSGEIQPWLAESWNQVDDTTVDFKLKSGISFHNGRELTADDVVFSLDRLLDANQNEGLTAASTVAPLDHAEAIDPQTVRVISQDPNPFIDRLMSRLFILPKDEFAAAGSAEAFFANPIGTGPFEYESFEPEGHLEVRAAETAWRTPKLAEVRFQALTSEAARVQALQSGDADMIEGVPPDQVSVLEGQGFTIDSALQAANYALDAFGPADTPHAIKEVRQAIYHAIDWQSIVDNLYSGLAEVGNGLIGGSNSFGWENDSAPYEFNPQKSRQLLEAAGFPNGFSTSMQASRGFLPADVAAAESIVTFLRDVGIDSSLETLDFSTFVGFYVSTYEDGRAPLMAHRQSYDITLEVGTRLRLFSDEVSSHPYNWDSPEFDALFDTANSAIDLVEREEAVLEANRLIRDEAISYAAMYLPHVVASKTSVSGVTPQPDAMVLMDGVSISA